MSEPESPAFHFVRHLYQNGQESTGHSWVRLNGALRNAVEVAIEGGLTFALTDFDDFYSRMKGAYWLGTPPDGLYSTACKYGNLSACKSFETFAGFSPYVLEGQRVHVGRDFHWDGQYVTCTSIAKDALIACSYKPDPKGYRSGKVKSRYSITNADMAAEEKRLSALAADKKMAKANSLADEWFKGNYRTDAQRNLTLDDALIGTLQDYEKERVLGVIKKRFKSVRPTMFAFVAMGFRFRDDHCVVTTAATRMIWNTEKK